MRFQEQNHSSTIKVSEPWALITLKSSDLWIHITNLVKCTNVLEKINRRGFKTSVVLGTLLNNSIYHHHGYYCPSIDRSNWCLSHDYNSHQKLWANASDCIHAIKHCPVLIKTFLSIVRGCTEIAVFQEQKQSNIQKKTLQEDWQISTLKDYLAFLSLHNTNYNWYRDTSSNNTQITGCDEQNWKATSNIYTKSSEAKICVSAISAGNRTIDVRHCRCTQRSQLPRQITIMPGLE